MKIPRGIDFAEVGKQSAWRAPATNDNALPPSGAVFLVVPSANITAPVRQCVLPCVNPALRQNGPSRGCVGRCFDFPSGGQVRSLALSWTLEPMRRCPRGHRAARLGHRSPQFLRRCVRCCSRSQLRKRGGDFDFGWQYRPSVSSRCRDQHQCPHSGNRTGIAESGIARGST